VRFLRFAGWVQAAVVERSIVLVACVFGSLTSVFAYDAVALSHGSWFNGTTAGDTSPLNGGELARSSVGEFNGPSNALFQVRYGLGDALVAARGTTTVIGKLDDLKNLRAGERTMLDRLPNRGSPQANWHQNSGVLRQEMARGLPIRDASVDSAGQLINNTGFLRAERNLLQSRGWTYNPSTTMWHPPVGP